MTATPQSDDRLFSVIQLLILAGALPSEEYEKARADIAVRPQRAKGAA